MNRPSLDCIMLELAEVLARRALCARRRVGCVLTDRMGRVVGSGYNGRPHGAVNCDGSEACAGECEGVHAEVNALLSALDPARARTCYVTCAPCWHCVKLLANSNVERIVFADDSTWETRSKLLWQKLGRSVSCLAP